MREVLTGPEFKNRQELEKELLELQKPLRNHIKFLLSRFKSPNLETDTDEVLQNTLIRAFRFLDDHEGESNLYGWVCAIAERSVYDFQRKLHAKSYPDRNPHTSQELSPEIPDATPSFETAILNKDLVKKLLALDPDPERRKIIELRYLYDVPGEAESVPAPAVVDARRTHDVQRRIA
jgi:DNA-directed RNA polymerase specialized sigma24 family protein